MSIDINNFGTDLTGGDDIFQSWNLILNTIPGSDPLRPNFGSGVFNFIDKPINQFDGDFIVQVIKDLERWEKRTTINQVVKTIENGNINVKIYGTLLETNTPIQAILDLNSLKSENLSDIQKAYSNAYNEDYSQ